MRPVPSPYNAATGGVTYAGRPVQPVAVPPLLPLWEVTYEDKHGTGRIWTRAGTDVDAVQELRRLRPDFASCVCKLFPVQSEEEQDDARCHGHPGAPHPSA